MERQELPAGNQHQGSTPVLVNQPGAPAAPAAPGMTKKVLNFLFIGTWTLVINKIIFSIEII